MNFNITYRARFVGVHSEQDTSSRNFEWDIYLSRGAQEHTFKYYTGLANAKFVLSGLQAAKLRKENDRAIKADVELIKAVKPYGYKVTTEDLEGIIVPLKPKLEEILESLKFDAQCVESLSFEDFCSELGYNPDSRKAEAVFKACLDLRSKIMKLFGSQFRAFMEQEIDC